jgi:hypothetical protein
VQCRLHEAEKYLIVQEGCFNLLQLKMHLQDWSQIDILSWGGRATGINPDWCSTPGIKQKVTSVHLCIHPPDGVQERRKETCKNFLPNCLLADETFRANHRNLCTRTSMFALVLQKFGGKDHLVKNQLISALDKVIYFKGTFFQGFTYKTSIHFKNFLPFSNMPLLWKYIVFPRISMGRTI